MKKIFLSLAVESLFSFIGVAHLYTISLFGKKDAQWYADERIATQR